MCELSLRLSSSTVGAITTLFGLFVGNLLCRKLVFRFIFHPPRYIYYVALMNFVLYLVIWDIYVQIFFASHISDLINDQLQNKYFYVWWKMMQLRLPFCGKLLTKIDVVGVIIYLVKLLEYYWGNAAVMRNVSCSPCQVCDGGASHNLLYHHELHHVIPGLMTI